MSERDILRVAVRVGAAIVFMFILKDFVYFTLAIPSLLTSDGDGNLLTLGLPILVLLLVLALVWIWRRPEMLLPREEAGDKHVATTVSLEGGAHILVGIVGLFFLIHSGSLIFGFLLSQLNTVEHPFGNGSVWGDRYFISHLVRFLVAIFLILGADRVANSILRLRRLGVNR